MRQQLRKIIAWHPVLTDHQAFTYLELSHQSGLPVLVQVTKFEDKIRHAQGWADTQVIGIERELIPRHSFLRYGLRKLLTNRDQIHLFGSAFEDLRLTLLLWLATRLGIECYIISEPYSPVSDGYFDDDSPLLSRRLKNWLRPTLYRLYVLALRGKLKGIFTISRLAATQYAAAGMPTDRLFPFGYFVPTEGQTKATLNTDRSEDRPLRFIFVGSLIARKGLPTLLAAVQAVIARGIDLQLDVYGPGDPTSFDINGKQIRYLGRIPFGQSQQYISIYDFLVLPSHYDGWGVVVNEALCTGVPVLCSDSVGARVLVENFGAGKVFPTGDERSLADLLFLLAQEPSRRLEMRASCAAAAEAIQPARAAAYMLEVMSADTAARTAIPSPWYRNT